MSTSSVTRTVGPPELPKCHPRLLRAEPAPGIGDCHVGRAPKGPIRRSPRCATRVGILNAVLEDVCRDNRHTVRIRNDHLVIGDAVFEGQTLRSGLLAERTPAGTDDVRQHHLLLPKGRLFAIEPGQHQEIANQHEACTPA
jgi:hypothetical protein